MDWVLLLFTILWTAFIIFEFKSGKAFVVMFPLPRKEEVKGLFWFTMASKILILLICLYNLFVEG